MEEASAALEVCGLACEVFDDPPTAWALHQETHLIPWRGAASGPLVDRFDARNLLDDRAQFRQLKKKRKFAAVDSSSAAEGDYEDEATSQGGGAPDAETAALLHRLRYADYAEEFPDARLDVSAVENRFPYEYPDDDAAAADNEEEEESDGEAFAPTFLVPDSIQVPKTRRRHAIVKATADKVRGNAQLEVMMKVRLGENPAFAFLRPESRLYAYYCFLRDQNPREGSLGKTVSASAGSLLLGAEYKDSEDDTKPSDAPINE